MEKPLERELHDLAETLSWADVMNYAHNPSALKIPNLILRLERVRASHGHFVRLSQDEGISVYGVTTGFGDNARRSLPLESQNLLQRNLLNYLDCAIGDQADAISARATLLCRTLSLLQGYSAVSSELVRYLLEFLSNGYAPVIPLDGSLGASGDLIPLASIGQALCGEGECYDAGGARIPSSQVLQKLNLKPFEFR